MAGTRVPGEAARDEWVDEVDRQDRFVRRTTRRRVRRDNLWHRCVWVIVRDSRERIFVHRRTATKDVYPAYWDVAAGGVLAAGETYDDGARRELEEELGIVAEIGSAVAEVCYEDETNRVVGRVYVCVYDGEPRLQASEIDTGCWVAACDLAEFVATRPFCPDGKTALARVLDADAWIADSRVRDELREVLTSERPAGGR